MALYPMGMSQLHAIVHEGVCGCQSYLIYKLFHAWFFFFFFFKTRVGKVLMFIENERMENV